MDSEEFEKWRDEWITVSQAAREIKTYIGKISKQIRTGNLQSKLDPLDERVVLVQRKAVYELFRRKLTP